MTEVELTPDQIFLVNDMINAWVEDKQRFREAFRNDCKRLLATVIEPLKDPTVVHINMLSGAIAKPTWEQIKHLYPEQFRPITMSDIRLAAGDGRLSGHDVLAAANAVLRSRV